MTYFNYNGKIYKEGDLVIGPDNRGLRYGDGLFETMKLLNGSLVMEDEHFARLWKGMNSLEFDIPKHFDPKKLENEIISLAKKNNQQQAARIRLNVLRGDGGLYDAKNHTPNYIIQTWPLPEGNGEWNSNGLVLGLYEAAKKTCDAFSNIKHNNYLPYLMAALHAKKEKWNDAILLNSHDRICDSTIANIFLVKDEKIYTPSLKEGCVAGVMRSKIIQELKTTDWQVKETEITVEEVMQADELFLTNSIYNIRWVKRMGDKAYSNIVTQKIFTAIVPTIQ